jgi:DNA polymerase III alpha subunit (gram-positive type)
VTDLYKLLGRPVALLDFETTGLNPRTDRVIEIAAIRHGQNGRHEFTTMVRPEPLPETLDPWVTERSGITPDMIVSGMPSYDAFTELWRWLLGAEVFVGHNLAKFDMAFLKAEFNRHGHPAHLVDFIDTMALAQLTGTGVEKLNRAQRPYLATTLTDVCQALAVPLEGAHRAMNDTRATEEILPLLYHRALDQRRPILNAMTHPQWLADKGQGPEYVPPRAIVYNVA